MVINPEQAQMIKETADAFAFALRIQDSKDISELLKAIQTLQKKVDDMHGELLSVKCSHEN